MAASATSCTSLPVATPQLRPSTSAALLRGGRTCKSLRHRTGTQILLAPTKPPHVANSDRPGPAPGISLKHIFPNLNYSNFYPIYESKLDFESPSLAPECRFSSYSKQLGKAIKSDEKLKYPVVLGFWESKGLFPLVHKHRDYIVNHVLEYHPAVVDYVQTKYRDLLTGARESVSVHFRLGEENEPGVCRLFLAVITH